MQVLLMSGWDDWMIWSWAYVNYVSMQFVLSLTVANILDEHGGIIIMVNSRTCNTNNETYYRYNCVVHVNYAYL